MTNEPLTNEELAGRYRTLLITLARTQQSIAISVDVIRDLAFAEKVADRKSNLFYQADFLSEQARELSRVIRRHSMSMRHFFGTVELKEVAMNRIPSDDSVLTIRPRDVFSRNYAKQTER